MAESRTFQVSPHSGYYKRKFHNKLQEQRAELAELVRNQLDEPVEDVLDALGREALFHEPKYSQKHLVAMRHRFLGPLPGMLRYYKLGYFLFIAGIVLLLWWSTTSAAPVPEFLPDVTWVKGLGYVGMLVLTGLSQWFRSHLEVVRKRQIRELEEVYAFHCGRELFISVLGSTFLREHFPLEDPGGESLGDPKRAVEYSLELVEQLVEEGALALIGSLKTAALISVLLVNDARAQQRGEMYLTGELLGIELDRLREEGELEEREVTAGPEVEEPDA